MAERYINTSEMTTHIARGILLWARVQNMRASEVQGSAAELEWTQWSTSWGIDWTTFVKKEQYDLFDRVNNNR